MEIEPVAGPGVLLNGVVDPARLDELGGLLAAFGLQYTLELSDDTDALVQEIRG